MDARSTSQLPLVVIVGPTASGKTTLAVALAKKYGGEIICADSRTVYKGMDIGTAKPTKAEQAQVPHWGLDLVEPGERFTAADFKVYAQEKIKEIRGRQSIPFLVGGTGLYVDSVLFDYDFGTPRNKELRKELEKLQVEELQDYCVSNNIKLPENKQNKRHLIAAIERNGVTGKRREHPISTSVIVGIATDKDILNQRIGTRTEHLFKDGVVEEAIILGKKYGSKGEAFTGNAYQVVESYLLGELTIQEVKEKITTLDRQLAKRQLTWFRRNKYVKWLSLSEAEDFIAGRLANL